MGPSWHMWLCILLAVLPSLLAGPIETCSQQLPCFQLTFAESPTTPTSVPCDAAAAPGCQWRVCLRLALGGAGCAKAATDTVRHTCVPNASSCTPTVWGPEAADVADGFMQCQTGPAGGQLTFSLGDGEGCADSSAEVTGGPLGWPAGAAARCAAAAGLTCGAGGGDCLWTITLPPCSGPSGSPPPGRRSSQRLKAAAVRSSPSPSPFGVCEDVPDWKDSVNFTCEDYAANFLCNPDGSYGDGWLLDLWGPFSAYADANGVDATEACCACGRPGFAPKSCRNVLPNEARGSEQKAHGDTAGFQFNLVGTICQLRRSRNQLVQTPSQLGLCYTLISNEVDRLMWHASSASNSPKVPFPQPCSPARSRLSPSPGPQFSGAADGWGPGWSPGGRVPEPQSPLYPGSVVYSPLPGSPSMPHSVPLSPGPNHKSPARRSSSQSPLRQSKLQSLVRHMVSPLRSPV